jgi:hypothetical protein
LILDNVAHTFFTIAESLNQRVAEVTSSPSGDTDQLTAGNPSPAVNDPSPSSGSGNVDAGAGTSTAALSASRSQTQATPETRSQPIPQNVTTDGKLLSHKKQRKEKKEKTRMSAQDEGGAPARSGTNARNTQKASGVTTSTGSESDSSIRPVCKSEQGGDENEGGHQETSRTGGVKEKEPDRLLSNRKPTDRKGSKGKGPTGASKHHVGGSGLHAQEQYNTPPASLTAPSKGTDGLGPISTTTPPANIGETHPEVLKPPITPRESSVLKGTPSPPFATTSQPAFQSNTDTPVFSAATVSSASNTVVVDGDAKNLHAKDNSAQGELCHIFLCQLIPITAVTKMILGHHQINLSFPS